MRKTALFMALLVAAAAACGSDTQEATTITIRTPASTAEIQTALMNINAKVIQFEEGVYLITEELSLTRSGVTLRGQTDRTKVVLDFSMQEAGSPNGFHGSGSNDLVIENMTFRDSPGDTLRVSNTNRVTFRNLHIFWTGGSATQNGAYALYPVLSENILVEDCEVNGASDAGIYVGQSKTAVVRRNKVSGNVTGIEIENTDDAEVVDNMALDNVSGILVFNLPNLPRKQGSRSKVHRNTIMANNRPPFAVAGSIVSYVSSGTGMILLANDNAEIHNNTFSGNESTAIVVVSCMTVSFLTDGALNCNDSAYDSFPEGLNIHDNTFTSNGAAPHGFYPAYWVDRTKPFFDVIWDGVVDPAKPNPNGALNLCIKANGSVTFARINPMVPGRIDSTDLAAHDCAHAAIPGVPVTW